MLNLIQAQQLIVSFVVNCFKAKQQWISTKKVVILAFRQKNNQKFASTIEGANASEETPVCLNMKKPEIHQELLDVEMEVPVDTLLVTYATFITLELVFKIPRRKGWQNQKQATGADLERSVSSFQTVLLYTMIRIFPS